MSKTKSAPKKAPKKVLHWSLGLFRSASNGGDPLVLYCRKDGTVAPYYAKKAKTKQALFHATYSGITYAEARKQLLKDAAKSSGKAKKLLADAHAAVKAAGRMAGEVSQVKETVAAK